jgi:hypothetical protein
MFHDIYIPNFIKIGSGIQKLIEEDSQVHRQHADRVSLLSFFENKEGRLKIEVTILTMTETTETTVADLRASQNVQNVTVQSVCMRIVGTAMLIPLPLTLPGSATR